MVFVVIELRTHAVHIAGVRVNPDGVWMTQSSRNLLEPVDSFLRNATHLIYDRDPLFAKACVELLKSSGVKSVRIPASSRTYDPYAERFVRTIRNECLEHFVIFGERHLRHLLREYLAHYMRERFHQGLGGRLIVPSSISENDNLETEAIGRRSRLGSINGRLREDGV